MDIPSKNMINCSTAFGMLLSLCSSGSKSALAMYMNPPAANGTKNADSPSTIKLK